MGRSCGRPDIRPTQSGQFLEEAIWRRHYDSWGSTRARRPPQHQRGTPQCHRDPLRGRHLTARRRARQLRASPSPALRWLSRQGGALRVPSRRGGRPDARSPARAVLRVLPRGGHTPPTASASAWRAAGTRSRRGCRCRTRCERSTRAAGARRSRRATRSTPRRGLSRLLRTQQANAELRLRLDFTAWPAGLAERFGGARRREVQRPVAGTPTHRVAALQLQEVEAVGQRPVRHARRHGRRHVEPHRHVHAGALARESSIARGRPSGPLVSVMSHVGGVAQRTIGAQHAHEAGDSLGVGGVGGRKHAAVQQRQRPWRARVHLHLPPLPRHALPEAPVVVVIAGALQRGPSPPSGGCSVPSSSPGHHGHHVARAPATRAQDLDRRDHPAGRRLEASGRRSAACRRARPDPDECDSVSPSSVTELRPIVRSGAWATSAWSITSLSLKDSMRPFALELQAHTGRARAGLHLAARPGTSGRSARRPDRPLK